MESRSNTKTNSIGDALELLAMLGLTMEKYKNSPQAAASQIARTTSKGFSGQIPWSGMTIILGQAIEILEHAYESTPELEYRAPIPATPHLARGQDTASRREDTVLTSTVPASESVDSDSRPRTDKVPNGSQYTATRNSAPKVDTERQNNSVLLSHGTTTDESAYQHIENEQIFVQRQPEYNSEYSQGRTADEPAIGHSASARIARRIRPMPGAEEHVRDLFSETIPPETKE